MRAGSLNREGKSLATIAASFMTAFLHHARYKLLFRFGNSCGSGVDPLKWSNHAEATRAQR